MILLTEHNLTFLTRLVAEARHGHRGGSFRRLQKRPQCCIFGKIASHLLGLRSRLPFCRRAIGN